MFLFLRWFYILFDFKKWTCTIIQLLYRPSDIITQEMYCILSRMDAIKKIANQQWQKLEQGTSQILIGRRSEETLWGSGHVYYFDLNNNDMYKYIHKN